MNIPFSNSEDLKRAMSGVDLKLDLENIRSSLERVPNDLIEIIGLTVYNDMLAYFNGPGDDLTEAETATWTTLVQLCQKAMFPLALYKHFIWLQIRVSNTGVTTYKGTDETTDYKYQSDEAKENLLDTWGDFVSQLIDHLNANEDVITSWPLTDQYAAQTNNLFTGYREFCKTAAISPADAAFYIRVGDMIKDITTDEVEPMLAVEDLDHTDPKFRKIQKFVAYRALSLAAIQFDIAAMPKPIRHVALNEMNSKNPNDFDYIKGKLAGHYKQEAETWLQKLSDTIAADTESATDHDPRAITRTVFTATDKVAGIC